MGDPSPVGPLQRRLALEHEAVWLTSLSAGRFPALDDAARAALRRHERARDVLVARVAAAGATPVGPQAAYGVPPRSVDQARQRLADAPRTSVMTSARATSRRVPLARSLTSSSPSASPLPTTTVVGMPSSSASLNLTPGDTFGRSS